jgi:hypothetical protein
MISWFLRNEKLSFAKMAKDAAQEKVVEVIHNPNT